MEGKLAASLEQPELVLTPEGVEEAPNDLLELAMLKSCARLGSSSHLEVAALEADDR